MNELVDVSADAVEVELVLNQGFKLTDFSGEETSTNPNARVPSTILASGDDLTILARFSVTPDALNAPLSLRINFKPLGSGQTVTYDRHSSSRRTSWSRPARCTRVRSGSTTTRAG
ncbi:MAG: hypothetical protein ACO1OB_08225 [Archangium sp.]